MIMGVARKLGLYFRAAWKLKSFHVRGLPLIPKTLFSHPLHNREAYNEFILWIEQLDLRDAHLILDVGANHGDFSQAAAEVFPEAEIFLFEPLPSLKERLENLCKDRDSRWNLISCALGSVETMMMLHLAEDADDIGSFVGFSEEYRSVNSEAKPVQQIECQVRPLDSIVVERAITKVDLLKIDVEGFELQVLEGAKKTLALTQALIIEFSLIRNSNQENITLSQFLSILEQAGFKIVNIIPSWFDKKNKWQPVEFNILAKRTDSIS